MERLRVQHRLSPEAIRRFRNAYYKRGEDFAAAAALLGEEMVSALPISHAISPLTLARRVDSEDGASKLILATAQEMLLETVILRIRSGRTTLCLSSQIGCAARCSFCATGKMKVAQSLTASEIVEQVVLARRLLREEGRPLRNLVFMGMGEPMHNREQVERAISWLTDPRIFDFHPYRILVSSVGIIDEIESFAAAMPKVNLAISLHSAIQSVREQIMPIAKRYPLGDLRELLVRLQTRGSRTVMLEYIMLNGVNDRPQDMQALIEFANGLDVHLNLIPYNSQGIEDDYRCSAVETIDAWSKALKLAGHQVTRRYSLGQDAAAACGQLVSKAQRERLAEIRRGPGSVAKTK